MRAGVVDPVEEGSSEVLELAFGVPEPRRACSDQLAPGSHVAVASLTLPPLAEAGEELAFASRDQAHSTVATLLGITQV